MKNCPRCGTPIKHTSKLSPSRCYACDAPIAERKQSQKDPSHSYSTPYGCLRGQLQIDGRWAIAYKISASNRSEADLDKIHQLADRLLKIKCVELARPHSFDEHALCFYWKTPKGFFPLSNVRRKLSSREAQLIITNIAGGLQKLHQAGLAAFDTTPELIFINPDLNQAILVPLPWLAELALHTPDAIPESGFLAPETGKDPLNERHTQQSADIYSLGELARYLITGHQTLKSSSALPSDIRPELQEWDTFIDGCCRSYPERRFSSIAAALDALPSSASSEYQHSLTERTVKDPGTATAGQSKGQATTEVRQSVQRPRRRAGKPLVLSLVVLSLFIFYINRNWIASIFPVAAGYIGSYQRGFGDTILSYEDRDYEGAGWTKMQDADSLLSLASIGDRHTVKPWRVAGWDDSSYWILCKDGDIFHFDDNHWKYLGSQNNIYNPIGRPLSRSCLLSLGSFYYNTSLYKIENTSWTDRGKIRVGRHYDPSSEKICIIAPDLSYLLFKGYLTKIEESSKTKLDADKYKEAFVHRDDNTPLKEIPVDSVSLTKTPKMGTAWGLATDIYSEDNILVQFRNGIWYKVDTVKDIDPHAFWLYGSPSDPDFIVVVGEDGQALIHEINGSDILIPITLAQEVTSGNLIAVWGVDKNKFWVMDKNGTVWERAENQWRTVIRGMYREDIEFLDAWVSPTGTVIAVTEDAVYRLE